MSIEKFQLTAKTLAGLESILAEELKALGAEEVTILKRAVGFLGDKELMYKANYFCRTALRILKPINIFNVKDEYDLYNGISKIDWRQYLDVNSTFAIDGVLGDTNFTHSQYIALKAKDAIADQFRRKFNKRPSVNVDDPDIRLNIFIHREECTVSLDSSGSSLHKRGYRVSSGIAPINEVLAAGLILLSGWKADCNLIDPMCGSGTILIEAAMIANHIPAGYYRQSFGFINWKDFDIDLWKAVSSPSQEEYPEFEFEILGADISEEMIAKTNENLRYAKLHKDIKVIAKSFEELDPPEDPGILIFNPPYGERIKMEDALQFYKMIGDTFKKKYDGYDAWIISSDIDGIKHLGLRATRRIHLFNGPLECRYLKFEIYQGSRKTPPNE